MQTWREDFGQPWPPPWRAWVGTASRRDGSMGRYGNGTDVARLTPDGAQIRAYQDGGWHSAFLYGPEFTYGTLTAKLRLPVGAGLRPAFWLVCADCDEGGWPGHGEIDIAETIAPGSTAYMTLIFPGADGKKDSRQVSKPLTPDWHVWSCDWQPDHVAISLDGQEQVRWTAKDVPDGGWCFGGDHPMKPVVSLAIGPKWPGPPDATTPSEATLDVAYVQIDA